MKSRAPNPFAGVAAGLAHVEVAEDRAVAQPAIAELRALATLDLALAPGVAMAHIEPKRRFLTVSSGADDLRLPPPPVRARDGDALFRAVSRAVDRFTASSDVAVGASSEAVVAEGRMMALLHGIRELERDVHALRDRYRRA